MQALAVFGRPVRLAAVDYLLRPYSRGQSDAVTHWRQLVGSLSDSASELQFVAARRQSGGDHQLALVTMAWAV
jgi:hypothetical protein